MKKIREYDQAQPIEMIGQYTDTYSNYHFCTVCHQFAIDHEVMCEVPHMTYKYFSAFAGGLAPQNTEEYKTYAQQDYSRQLSYNSGNWHYLSIRAEHEVIINNTVQTLRSGGLHGIESDLDESFLKSVEEEQRTELEAILIELNILNIASFNSFEIVMTKEQAESVSHQGQCDTDVDILVQSLKDQLNKLSGEDIANELKEHGAWTEEELKNDDDNLQRIVWIAGCQIAEGN